VRVLRYIVEATSYAQARAVFQRETGVDPSTAQPDELKRAHRSAVMRLHPDRGGDEERLKLFNDAYDVVKRGAPSAGRSHEYDDDREAWAAWERKRRQRQQETPTWAWSDYSGGSPPQANIFRNDYRDVNFIKKDMWERSGESHEKWTIWGFDGSFFRGVVTVFGSPKIFDKMAEAMVTWQTRGGNPYPCRAVFVSNEKLHKTLLLIWLDGKFYKKPIEFHHYSMNSNPSNDRSFLQELPARLDAIAAGSTE